MVFNCCVSFEFSGVKSLLCLSFLNLGTFEGNGTVILWSRHPRGLSDESSGQTEFMHLGQEHSGRYVCSAACHTGVRDGKLFCYWQKWPSSL